MTTPALATLLALFALWSCGEPAEEAGAPPLASLSPDPIWAVGGADGPDAEVFSRISGARRLGDGSVVVGVQGFFEVRKFGPDGVVRWTVGRRGAGPGEFARLQLLRNCSEDRVVVYDASIFRVTEFDQEGERLATWQLPSGEGAPFQVTCAPDGRIIFFPAGHFPSEPGIVRWHVPVLWVSSDTRSPQLIRDEVPGPERALEVGDGGYWEIPWSRQLVLGATNEGVWMGTGDDYTLEFVGWNRSVLDTLDWAGRDQAVTPADIDQLRAELTQGL